MKHYSVRLSNEVEYDLIDLFEYVARKDSIDSAYYVLDKIETLISNLDQHPARGHIPPELREYGIKAYREILFKPYRIIYEVIGNQVIVLACFDGRRDMQSLLERRLLR